MYAALTGTYHEGVVNAVLYSSVLSCHRNKQKARK